ncbi:tetratricopeptide repeat protein [Ureibacillus manganicus]|uniref:Hydrolase n=1 Tax=Ureibacillus manganicus DSM 26584 TaxID=1384049 RepID=A0A0A3I1G1_9BACL|nr:hypothetical protein [Ureibacillus manganicus]KGR78676.1 hypothetical protein CD29_09875 [Ureibacillus manganicus DSM 26584]
MKKKKKKIQKYENVVVFPGTVDRLISTAHQYVENHQFDLANQHFQEALQYTEGDDLTLSVYAYSLYESKAFEKAKEVCDQLLSIGPTMYLEVMELYLTILMQLKEYRQVETIISSLLEEGAIPASQVDKFERLKNINANIVGSSEHFQEVAFSDEVQETEKFELNHFQSLTSNQQLLLIQELTESNIRPIVENLKDIVEHEWTHPFVKSLILILLVEQEVNVTLTISKFQRTMEVNPSKLLLPTKLPKYQQVLSIVIDRLEQEPSKLEMVEYLISKHAIANYPFEWLDYESEDIAYAYIDFVSLMFGSVQEVDYELIDFLQKLEEITELRGV